MTDHMTKLIMRINQLAHKSKSQGLTEAELKERDKLRQQYLQSFRQSMKIQLDAIEFKDDNNKKN